MRNHLDDARVEAVKSATEVINSVSKRLFLKDLDLFLIDTLMTPRGLSFWSICDDWASRDFRQVGVIYGGGLAILSLILLSLGAFIYLPLVLISLVTGRYFLLRNQFTKMARMKSTHLQTIKIARYLVLHSQGPKKKPLFHDMSVKYTMLKYIKDKNSINGADYLNMFTHINEEVGFYRLLHGVIDDVLLYAVAKEASLVPNDELKMGDEERDNDSVMDENLHHDSDPQDILKEAPERTQKDEAEVRKNHFEMALSNGEDKSPLGGSELHDVNGDGCDEVPDNEDHENHLTGENRATEEVRDSHKAKETLLSYSAHDEESDHAGDEEKDEDTEDEREFSLDDFDEDDFDVETTTSSVSNEEDDESDEDILDDIDDDLLEEIGLAEEDYK